MFFDLTIDDDRPKVIQIAEEKETYKSRKVKSTIGIIPRKKCRESDILPEIKLKETVFVPLYTTIGGYPNRYVIVGQSTAGKSTICGLIAKSYRKQYKQNDVFVFSSLDEDEVLDICKPIRIELNEEFLEKPFQLSMFANSLCIFDDLSDMIDIDIYKKVLQLRDKMYGMGRKYNIAVMSSDQLAFKGLETKSIMTNGFTFIMFPIVSKSQCVAFLTRYMFLPKEQILKICNLKSRWILINKANPMYVLAEHDYVLFVKFHFPLFFGKKTAY